MCPPFVPSFGEPRDGLILISSGRLHPRKVDLAKAMATKGEKEEARREATVNLLFGIRLCRRGFHAQIRSQNPKIEDKMSKS